MRRPEIEASPVTVALPSEGLKHSRFFFDGDLVTFMVEGTLYRVHEYLFTANSSFWLEKLGARVDKAEAIELEDVVPRDIDALLTVLYDTTFQGYDLKTTEAWESVLRLSTRWTFRNIRALAISQLDSLATPLQKLVMARAFDVPQWLGPSLVALCMRPSPLTLAEGKQLSTEDLISIMSMRENVRHKAQINPVEQEVISYIAKHVIRTGPLVLFPASDTVVPVTALAIAASSTSTSQLSLSTSKLAVATESITLTPEVPTAPSISATPSVRDIHCLISALSKSDYDGAVAMVTLEGTSAFVNALTDFTGVLKDHQSSGELVAAILRRGSKDTPFIPIGVKLISGLPKRLDCTYGGYNHYLPNFLTYCHDLLEKVGKAVDRVRCQFGDFDLALHHINVGRPCGDPRAIFGILDIEDTPRIMATTYDIRADSLKSFFLRLKDAKSMC